MITTMTGWRAAGAVALIALAAGGCDRGSSPGASAALASTTVASTSAEAPSTDPPTATAPEVTARPDPEEGWRRLDVDTAVFGGAIPIDGASRDGTVVLVACPSEDLADFPVWWSDSGFDFERASGPETSRRQDVRCVQQVVSTSFGWFAGGLGPLLRSGDGGSWEIVDVPAILGYEETFQLGYVDDLFVSPDGERLTVLYRRAAMSESTVATLVTTTDGKAWVQNAHPSQSLFDSGGIAAVIEGGDGLLGVGAFPGGEFVPTAAAFTSPDGLRWRRVTPRGDPDFENAVMHDVMRVGDRYIAVGSDHFGTGLMTAWSSPDGFDWRRLPPPPETTDPSVAFMTGEALGVVDGSIWVSGIDFDARRSEPQGLPALWQSTDGEAWERIPIEDLELSVPFEITSTAVRIGVWPPPSSPLDEPLVLYVAR